MILLRISDHGVNNQLCIVSLKAWSHTQQAVENLLRLSSGVRSRRTRIVGGTNVPNIFVTCASTFPGCADYPYLCRLFLVLRQTHSEKWHHDSSSPFRCRSLCRTLTRRYSHSSPRKHQKHHGHITGLFPNSLLGSSWSSILLLAPHQLLVGRDQGLILVQGHTSRLSLQCSPLQDSLRQTLRVLDPGQGRDQTLYLIKPDRLLRRSRAPPIEYPLQAVNHAQPHHQQDP